MVMPNVLGNSAQSGGMATQAEGRVQWTCARLHFILAYPQNHVLAVTGDQDEALLVFCVKCGTMYSNRGPHKKEWLWDDQEEAWYCHACVREASRDAKKEFETVTDATGSVGIEVSGKKAGKSK